MTDLNRVDLNLLPMLAALLEHRSVTRAAQEVGLTQPAMSNALSRLRRTLGDRLLVRVGRESVLTARAEALIAPVNSILESVRSQVLSPGHFDPATTRRTFRIAASSATCVVVLPSLSATIASSAPGVQVLMEPQSSMADFTTFPWSADVALLPASIGTPLPRDRLYREDVVVVADAANRHIGDTLTVDDLTGLPHVVFEYNGIRLDAQRTLESTLPDLNVQISVFDFMMIPALVRHTRMVALLQRRLAEFFAQQGGLRVHESPIPLPSQAVDMVWNPRNAGDPGCEWLRGALLKALV
ncbi:LysR family transcriptional regulator [Streptomyces sp. NPDC004629]|uniref:LysR family transcriptional regulator n=1 Tax=Streptomyces sp. NPDC004629 TaxID=3364705 RepID=UPI003673E3FB